MKTLTYGEQTLGLCATIQYYSASLIELSRRKKDGTLEFSIILPKLELSLTRAPLLRFPELRFETHSPLEAVKAILHLSIFFNWKPQGQLVRLPTHYATMTFREWTIWEKNYLPSFPLKGKTVIDVGAGAGETAYFFLAHGASHVICVEPNPIALRFLRENTERNHWPTRIIPRRFDLSMLNSFKFDFAKMDAEGAEIQLLQLTRYPHPMSVEVHSLAVAEKLARKLGGKISHSAALGVWFLRINC